MGKKKIKSAFNVSVHGTKFGPIKIFFEKAVPREDFQRYIGLIRIRKLMSPFFIFF